MITIFKNITDSKNPYFVDIPIIIERIKTGKNKELIETIRAEKDKETRNKLKGQLPSICFSGKFSKRSNDSCIELSGLVCCDFDHVDNLQELKASLIQDKYTHICFISPSGDGIKVVIKIPANKDTHKQSCIALKAYYNNENFDLQHDLARVCFESYDPDIYYNSESILFEELAKDEKVKIETNEVIKDDYEIFLNLKKWIETSETYIQGNRQKFIVKFAGALNRFGVYRVNSISYLKNTYQNLAGKFEDIEKIVEYIYNTYSSQNNISYFDKKGISYEYKTKEYTPKDFFQIYEFQNEDDAKIKEIINKTMIDINCPPPQMPAYLKIRKSKSQMYNVRLFTAGNISAIKGKAKSKKTFLISLLAGCLISNEMMNNLLYPTLDVNKGIILIDTEQSKYDTWKVTDRIRSMSKYESLFKDNFVSICCRGYDNIDIISIIKYLVKNIPGIAIIIIDQIADLAKSVNDEKEAIALIRFLEKITIDYNIHVCCVIHENPLTEKATGWIGSQILKKAETILTVSKDGENNRVSNVCATYTRGEDFEDFKFRINDNGIPELFEGEYIINDSNVIPF